MSDVGTWYVEYLHRQEIHREIFLGLIMIWAMLRLVRLLRKP